MALHPFAGQPAPASVLVDVSRLLKAYEQDVPDVTQPTQKVAFGTSGHRGSSLKRSFNRAHILCITQAVCEYRASQGIAGVMYVGRDSHGLSAPAQDTALEVLAAHGVNVRYAAQDALTPTPVISHAILTANRGKPAAKADGLIITPSHNPPEDGGIKYNPPHGGPADTNVTRWIEDRANELLRDGGKTVKRSAWNTSAHIQAYDFVTPYVEDLRNVLDFTALSQSGLRLGADPLGGSSVGYWDAIAARYRINLDVVNRTVDPTFGFMPLDHDGKIRMDCSSPQAMANLVRLKDRYDIAFGNDADSDRHGIVTRSGLMNPNHFLAVAIADLFGHRGFGPQVRVGKTLVSSAMIDRVARDLQRTLVEVPVGFKWFVDGLLDGTLGFGGEESAGASFLRLDGTAWTTDKDGIILDLLAADILARTGKDPSQQYAALEQRFGSPRYVRLDQACTPAQKALFKKLTPESVTASALAGEPITARLTRAPGNNADIGGLKVVTENGWFAARPSGTEDVYKIYAESFLGEDHLKRIVDEAAAIVTRALG